jgi:hypothetical protein
MSMSMSQGVAWCGVVWHGMAWQDTLHHAVSRALSLSLFSLLTVEGWGEGEREAVIHSDSAGWMSTHACLGLTMGVSRWRALCSRVREEEGRSRPDGPAR